MSYTILHNPNCSTSRKGLDMLKEAGVEPEVRKYMNATERLSVEELKDIAKKMGGVSPRAFMRAKDAPPPESIRIPAMRRFSRPWRRTRS
jgi:arsenate reductase